MKRARFKGYIPYALYVCVCVCVCVCISRKSKTIRIEKKKPVVVRIQGEGLTIRGYHRKIF